METNTSNNYNNIIAPSDGVRRFLSRPSVLVFGIIATIYCVFSFRMNAFEHDYSGGSLRTTMLYAAYIMLPLGILTAYIFAKIKKVGLAFSMISLLISTTGLGMLFLNSISALLRESTAQGIVCSLFEMLTYIIALAVFINLMLSCMEFRIISVFGAIGTALAVLAAVLTVVGIILNYGSIQFAWNGDFDWNNLASQVSAGNSQYQAKHIFRCISLNSPEDAKLMFSYRLCERISACAFYVSLIVFFAKYKSEMSKFNKLMEHAKEYVDIPQVHIAESIAQTERIISEKLKASTSSVKERLRSVKNAGEEDADEFDPLTLVNNNTAQNSPNNDSEGNRPTPRPRRRPDDDFSEGRPAPRPRRRPDDDFSEGRPAPRPRRRPDDDFSEGRPAPRPRRRPDDDFSEGRPAPRPRRRPDDDFSEGRSAPRPRRRPDDDFSEGRPAPRPRRRPDDEYIDERSRRREENMTEEERYLIEERRRRNPNYDAEQQRRMRQNAQIPRQNIERDYRQERMDRRKREEGGTQQNLNEYYNKYMKIQRGRDNNNNKNK